MSRDYCDWATTKANCRSAVELRNEPQTQNGVHVGVYLRATVLKSICIQFDTEVVWSIMASFMLYVVDKYAWDFYMENANF